MRSGMSRSAARGVAVVAVAGGVLMAASAASGAATLTSRLSQLSFAATYGGGETAFTPGGPATDGALLATDSNELNFADSVAGFVLNDPERPWNASVGLAAQQTYAVTGPLSDFSRIQASGRTAVSASAGGEGLATMVAQSPGNSLELYFTLSDSVPATFSGVVDLSPDGQNLAAGVALQRFDGIVWANLFNSLFLVGQEGVFDLDLALTPGEYRVQSFATGNAFAGVRPSQENTWRYDLQIVPGAGGGVALLAGGVLAGVRRRR
jgi:hypothetical protein